MAKELIIKGFRGVLGVIVILGIMLLLSYSEHHYTRVGFCKQVANGDYYFYDNFKSVTICSAILSVICSLLGMIISILGGTPVGSTIVAVDVAAFIICYVAGRFLKGAKK